MNILKSALLSLLVTASVFAQSSSPATDLAGAAAGLRDCAIAAADQVSANNTRIAKPETSCYAGAMACGQTVTGRVSTDSCESSGSYGVGYTFNGTAGQVVTIAAKATSFDFTPVIGLGDGRSGNSTIYALDYASSAYGTATISSFTLPYTGPYMIIIMPTQTYTYGNFSITLTCAAPPPPPNSCTSDSHTACLLGGRFKATVRYRGAFDNANVDTDALVKPVSGFSDPSYETAFFYFNSPNNIEMMLKMLDQGNTNSAGQPTIAVLYGSATPLRFELTLTDTRYGAVKRYTSSFSSQTGQTDFTAFVK